MTINVKNIIPIFLFLYWLSIFNSAASQEFDPFAHIKTSTKGSQLIDIIKFAEHDVELAMQQLNALSESGVAKLGLEYQVAEHLAYLRVYIESGDFEKMPSHLKELHLIGVKKGNDWVLSHYFEQQSALALRQGHFLKGFEDASKAIEIAESINYSYIAAQAKVNRAVFHGKMGRGSRALEDYIDAAKFFESVDNTDGLAAIYNNLVVLYIDRKDYIEALSASDNAIATLNKLPKKSTRLIAINYINRAIILSQLERPEEELTAFTLAQEFSIKSNDVAILTSVYANLSDYFLRYGNYTLAIERALKCIETSDKIKDVYTLAICQLNKGLSLIYLDKNDDGFEALNQALSITKAGNMQSTLIDVYDTFYKAYQHINDHKLANEWLVKRYEILLTQAKNDKEHYFQEMEESFKKTVAEREEIHKSFKSSMMGNILNQETLVARLWGIIVILVCSLVIALTVIARLKKKPPKYN